MKKAVIIISCVSLFFALLAWLAVVRQVHCALDQGNLESGVCELLEQQLRGKSLLWTDVENLPVWAELATSPELVQSYRYQGHRKSLTGQIWLFLSSRPPAYRLVVGEDSFLLGDNNRLRQDHQALSLLTIEILPPAAPNINHNGYLDDYWFDQLGALAAALSRYDLQPERVRWLSEQEIQLLFPKLTVLLDTEKDFAWQAERLKAIWQHQAAASQLEAATLLDLRFNLPVLK